MNDEYGYDWDGDEKIGIAVAVEEETIDSIGWEKMFHQIPQEQLEILVCLYLGFKPKEIVDILQLSNIVRYYNASTKLRQIYKEQKDVCLDYN